MQPRFTTEVCVDMREEILQSEAVAEPALFWDSLKTGILVLVIGLFGFWNGNVLLIPSLAPSAIYQVLRPDLPSSRCSNLILGHVIGIFCTAYGDESLIYGPR